jgi:hypothetical protein
MGVITHRVSVDDVSTSKGQRIDSRYHFLRSRTIAPLGRVAPMRSVLDESESIANGLNLPSSTYAETVDDAEAHYASVAALSQFYFREDACTPLLGLGDGRLTARVRIDEVAVRPNELLLTRSGTPGIASSAEIIGDRSEIPVIPSGFLMRITLRTMNATYVAAIVNHPLWRLNTFALSAGKRQDNISQSTLAELQIPSASGPVAEDVARSYLETLAAIEQATASDSGLESACDAIIRQAVPSSGWPEWEIPVNALRRVSLRDVGNIAAQRIDNRWHGFLHSTVRSTLQEQECLYLGDLLVDVPGRGKQNPAFDGDRDDETPLVITTAAIQAGQWVEELARPTTPDAAARFVVSTGDVLIAMDGEGSLGKAAWISEAPPGGLTADSHVGRLRFRNPEIAGGVACFLNSTWGRAQSNGYTTGATGQTQISGGDLSQLLVPKAWVEEFGKVGRLYQDLMSRFEAPAKRSRRILAQGAGEIGEILVEGGLIVENSNSLESICDPSTLRGMIELIHDMQR